MQVAPRWIALAACAAVSFGCATTAPRPRPTLAAVPVADAQALEAAAEAFYAAGDAQALRRAVAEAEKAAPGAGLTHELLAQLARLEMREADEVDHLLAACADPAHDGTLAHLRRLSELTTTEAQLARHVGLLEALADSHPKADVRAAAAYALAGQLHAIGDDAGRDEALRRVTGVLPFTVVGGWDNDQGKGFDTVWPPELGFDPAARYDGALTEVRWQTPPIDLRGEVELGEFIAPEKWSVAYAAAGVVAPRDGTYELRLGSTDPLKVWVNGELAFSVRDMEDAFTFDQFVVPVALRAGQNQIVVKSAHRTGDWRLYARITAEGGADAQVRPQPPAKDSGPEVAQKALTEEAALAAHVAGMKPAARRAFHRTAWAARIFGGNSAARISQEYARAYPDSILARDAQIAALWDAGERGRTADELTLLDRRAGADLPLVRRQIARFWQQEGLRSRARKTLVELSAAFPDRAPAARQLARLFHAENWIEDECRVLESLRERTPASYDLDADVARCWDAEGREDRAIALLRGMLERRPRELSTLRDLEDMLRERGRFAEAADVSRRMIAAYPEKLWPRLRLAEALRRAGDDRQSDEVLAAAEAAFPSSADVRRARAHLAWRRGDEKAAVAAWQAALERSPEDEATANRLDFVAPESNGPWAADAPDEEAIQRAVAERKKLEPAPGADLAYLLDHEVTQLRADGSTINVVTHVVTALNQAGRDHLTRRRLDYPGRSRVLHAYSIDAQGRRSEASVRSREVLYRGLDVGSTIVLQYRADSPPGGFLPRYLSRAWFFQASKDQRVRSEFILWYPAGSKLNERVVGELDREERKVGDEIRVRWRLDGAKPLVAEPNMPGLAETAAHIQISTVPGWEAYESWEEALLEGAFRDSPEVDELAERLVKGAATAEEKLFRIHEFVMEEIRYQQDYESFIAGVKPHTASMVLERRYGDCKDKTVLFMTLAKKAGLKAHFATVRTRPRGQVRKEIPSQQFDHAIVYVPAQDGVPEGRFFDATADALDLDVLRDDNAGTESLVYDPETREHTWRQIPWQTTAHHTTRTELRLALAPDGSAQGELALSGRGRMGSLLRRASRNPESFKQFVQMVAGAQSQGASISDPVPAKVGELREPARISARISAPNAGRREGNALRLRLPAEGGLKSAFNLAERRHPLVLGTPGEQHWRYELTFPEGMRPSRLPSSGEVSTECITLKRTVTPGARAVTVDQSLVMKCERISPAEYPAYRAQMEQMTRFLDEELVLEPSNVPVVRPAKATRAR